MSIQKLHIGLTQYQLGWEIMLHQIGIDWSVCDFSIPLSENDFSVIILNGSLTSVESDLVKQFVQAGGAVLSIHGAGKNIFFQKTKEIASSFLHPNTIEYELWHSLVDIPGKSIFESEPIHSYEKGFVLSIPFDVHTLVINDRSVRKNFFVEDASRFPNEVVAEVTKGGVRKLVHRILEKLHHLRKLPFVHKWYFPNQEQTIFTFRVDTDSGTREQIQELYSISKQYSIPTMWFVDVQSHEQWLSVFSSFEHQEIGVHCYRHKIFQDDCHNKENIVRAKQLLEHQHCHVTGMAMPYGTWNAALGKIMQELNFPFSSEFALNYDDVPFFPVVNNSISSVLQIPIHPVSIGIMKRARISEEQMTKYYLKLIETYRNFQEPICLYHHPTHLHFTIFKSVFERIRELNILTLSYSEYASWWKKRLVAKPKILFDSANNTLQLTGSLPQDVMLHVTIDNKNETFIQSNGKIILSELNMQQRPKVQTPPVSVKEIRSFDWRHYVINYLEKKYKARK